MTKKSKKKEPKTGEEFVGLAREKGAHISHGHSHFVSIETPKGKVYINPSHDKLDKQTISNLKRWFRLLGLMVFIIGIFLLRSF